MTHHTSLKLNHFPQKLYGHFISRSMHFKPQQISADTNNNNDESSPPWQMIELRAGCALCRRHQIKCSTFMFILLFYFYFTPVKLSKQLVTWESRICTPLAAYIFIWLLSYFAELSLLTSQKYECSLLSILSTAPS